MNWSQPAYPAEASVHVVDEVGIVNHNFPIGLLEIQPLAHKPSLHVISICELADKNLVAVPNSVWHRQKSNRVLPNQWLTRATPVEVAACSMTERELEVEGLAMKIWVGYMKKELFSMIDFLVEDLSVEYMFDAECPQPALPFGQALADAANEHFSFLSASDGLAQESLGTTPPAMVEGGGEPGSVDVAGRMEKLEQTVAQIAASVQALTGAPGRPSALKKKSTPSSSQNAPRVTISAKAKPMASAGITPEDFPQLDAGVVKAAVNAGLGQDVLHELARLTTPGTKAAKMGDLNPVIEVDPLSEQEEEDAGVGASGSLADGGDPLQTAVVRLTDIVQVLAADKSKKQAGSKVESALEQINHPSVADAGMGTGKRAAAARRALRAALRDHPLDIANMIEEHMWADVHSQTPVPGMSSNPCSVRAWMEHRSRIGSYKTAAHMGWAIAGALDCIINQRFNEARARLGIAMLQLDQVAIDRGSWTLAAELSLEMGPPMSSLETHRLPDPSNGESVYSKILDARWAEIALAHLRDQEEFATKRRNLNQVKPKKDAEDESEGSRKRPKAKAKPKAAADSTA